MEETRHGADERLGQPACNEVPSVCAGVVDHCVAVDQLGPKRDTLHRDDAAGEVAGGGEVRVVDDDTRVGRRRRAAARRAAGRAVRGDVHVVLAAQYQDEAVVEREGGALCVGAGAGQVGDLNPHGRGDVRAAGAV